VRLWYDLHLHSCLSPCGDAEMTPYNIAHMAALLGYDIIALTDHNTAGNCRAAIQAGGEAGVVVVPGMELCTSEEIHVVCLLPDIGAAERLGARIAAALPPIRNKAAVFGAQLYMDARDRVLGEEEAFLMGASSVSIEEVRALADEYGGFCYPAHIDRLAHSLLPVLGTVPPELGFTCAEVTPAADSAALREAHPALREMRILRSSDAHYLENMPDPAHFLELPERSAQAVLAYLRGI